MVLQRAHDPRRAIHRPEEMDEDDQGNPIPWNLASLRRFNQLNNSYYELWKAYDFNVENLITILDTIGWGDYYVQIVKIANNECELL